MARACAAGPVKGALVIEQSREEIAGMLLGAYTSRQPVEPLTEKYDDLTMADAYEIQLLQVRRWLGAGARIKGHKVGLTSAAMQRQLGVGQPDYGHLLDSMFWLEHEPIPAARFLQPRVEPEIAFVLEKELRGPGVTAADAIGVAGDAPPALELIDSRIRDWRIGLLDTIADNASSAGVILGSSPVPLAGKDLRLAGLQPAQERRAGGDGRGRRGAGLTADGSGLAGQHAGRARRRARAGPGHPARLGDRRDPGRTG